MWRFLKSWLEEYVTLLFPYASQIVISWPNVDNYAITHNKFHWIYDTDMSRFSVSYNSI